MTGVSTKNWQVELLGFLDEVGCPLVVVLGPTASGKTAFSIELCHFLSGQGRVAEVVNADSRQLYKYLDIGTAKITEEERSDIPHHMMDVLDPREEATAGWYQLESQRVIDDILRRNSIPMLVGGSMLYISSVIDGLTMAPSPDSALRARLMNEYAVDQGRSLHQRLQNIDPEAAEQFHRHNKPRLVRAVEIFELTNMPKSTAVPQTELRSGSTSKYDLFVLGITRPRQKLHRRINDRVRAMFDAGWIEEIQGLLERGYTPADPGMKSHGYREIVEYIQLQQCDIASLQETIAAKTRQYAKRQITWWNRDQRIHWVEVDRLVRSV